MHEREVYFLVFEGMEIVFKCTTKNEAQQYVNNHS